jgi:hypothetical protein
MHMHAGGSRASEGMSSFSKGFGWANFDLGLTLPGRNTSTTTTSRRSSKPRPKDGTTDIDLGDEVASSCSTEELLPPIEILITCLCVIVSVSVSRQLLVFILMHFLHKDQPPSLFFGVWEGPVLLAQYLAVCDSAIGAAALRSLSHFCVHASLYASIQGHWKLKAFVLLCSARARMHYVSVMASLYRHSYKHMQTIADMHEYLCARVHGCMQIARTHTHTISYLAAPQGSPWESWSLFWFQLRLPCLRLCIFDLGLTLDC